MKSLGFAQFLPNWDFDIAWKRIGWGKIGVKMPLLTRYSHVASFLGDLRYPESRGAFVD